MVLPLNVQIAFLLSTIAAGMLTGLMFDVYRIIRGFNCPNKILTAISDVLFWIFAAVVIFTFFLYTNNGDMRYYTIVGLLGGLYFYIRFVSKWFIFILRNIIYYFLKVVRIIFTIIIFPFKIILYFIKYAALKSDDDMREAVGSIKNVLKRLNKRRKKVFFKE